MMLSFPRLIIKNTEQSIIDLLPLASTLEQQIHLPSRYSTLLLEGPQGPAVDVVADVELGLQWVVNIEGRAVLPTGVLWSGAPGSRTQRSLGKTVGRVELEEATK